MSDLPNLWFKTGPDLDSVAERQSSTIPRIGETVWFQSKTWKVTGVDYLYPSPGSMDYNAGQRSPIVTVLVEGSNDE